MTQPFVSASDKVGLGTRFGARVLDGLILIIPILLVTGPVAGASEIGSGNRDGRQIAGRALGVRLAVTVARDRDGRGFDDRWPASRRRPGLTFAGDRRR
ncbi:MAG TPA: hypothetical protein VEG38_22405 [Acidimicrobiia bacterium]|nr:hypothetical protein [Acidimicrobiia bacterium]